MARRAAHKKSEPFRLFFRVLHHHLSINMFAIILDGAKLSSAFQSFKSNIYGPPTTIISKSNLNNNMIHNIFIISWFRFTYMVYLVFGKVQMANSITIALHCIAQSQKSRGLLLEVQQREPLDSWSKKFQVQTMFRSLTPGPNHVQVILFSEHIYVQGPGLALVAHQR